MSPHSNNYLFKSKHGTAIYLWQCPCGRPAMRVPEARGEGHAPCIPATKASHALHVPFFLHFFVDLSEGLLASAGVHDGHVQPVVARVE